MSSVRWLVPVVLAVAAASVGAGVVARDVYTRPNGGARTTIVVSTPLTTSTAASAELPGDPTVQLSQDAAVHPDGEVVRGVLQRYFDSINDKNYDNWRDAVTRERGGQYDRARWNLDFSTSRDGDVLVHRIDDASVDTLRVLLSFTSTQELTRAPADFQHSCIRWRVVHLLAWEDGELKMEAGPQGRTPQRDPC
ncbi:hypothetical protein [Umezawaea beigongshangensis]|uniref:hypothetical protein n=1 Tax=Umezawaea beigongshangensis TaxID=2780383 RepID=UPI0018F14D95|nr:hypothetical protein [Umezawaea beigongshangensis]